jgi:hypothetical protein
MADFTLPYQSNPNLDYDKIVQTCETLVVEMENFDDKLHHMPCPNHKGLMYYFRYIKKNLLLIAAVDIVPGLYQNQIQERFEELHEAV